MIFSKYLQAAWRRLFLTRLLDTSSGKRTSLAGLGSHLLSSLGVSHLLLLEGEILLVQISLLLLGSLKSWVSGGCGGLITWDRLVNRLVIAYPSDSRPFSATILTLSFSTLSSGHIC